MWRISAVNTCRMHLRGTQLFGAANPDDTFGLFHCTSFSTVAATSYTQRCVVTVDMYRTCHQLSD
jgi:hypothetical protein